MSQLIVHVRHLLTNKRYHTWILAGVGLTGLIAASALRPESAESAASQDWSPFVLVTGLLLIGIVADTDGLFSYAGQQLARITRGGIVLFIGSALLIGLVTAVLNLDTSVAFLTPVLVYAARARGEGEAVLLYGCILLSNAGSLFLPGSNLTNLIVIGAHRPSGATFLAHMWAPALVALVITALVIVAFEHRELGVDHRTPAKPERPKIGLGLVAVAFATALVLILNSPAPAVAAVGVITVGIRVMRGKEQAKTVVDIIGLPLLVGLFAIAVTLGTLGRAWSGPTVLLSHLNLWGTAVIAAISTVVVNNLPAASLLAARLPKHPYALLIGLNIGPNLFVTGSLAWILWLRAARTAGAKPSIARASRIGVVAVPLAMVASLAVLSLTGLS